MASTTRASAPRLDYLVNLFASGESTRLKFKLVELRNDPNGRVLQSAPTPYQLLALRGWHKLRLGKSCTTSER
jgi:hypothetical protein